MARRFASLLAVWLLTATVLAACSFVGWPGSSGQVLEREHQQAHDALARWAAALKAGDGQPAFVPVGELTGQIGDWEQEVGDNNKRALMAGMVVAAVSLPADSPGEKEIRWADGTKKMIRTISAAQALDELRRTGSSGCPDCIPLRATSANLTTATIETSRGSAVAPAWAFTIAGTNVRVTRIAVAADDATVVVSPPWDPNNAPIGISIDSATGSVTGRELNVAFTGAPDGADKPCGADYTAEAVESIEAIVVIVVEHRNAFIGACAAIGARRTATTSLAAPLDERVVLEVTQGLPVPVSLTP